MDGDHLLIKIKVKELDRVPWNNSEMLEFLWKSFDMSTDDHSDARASWSLRFPTFSAAARVRPFGSPNGDYQAWTDPYCFIARGMAPGEVGRRIRPSSAVGVGRSLGAHSGETRRSGYSTICEIFLTT